MKKIIYGWLVLFTMPLTVLGYSEVVVRVNPPTAVDFMLTIFGSATLVFQFIMTTSLITRGWKELGLNNPFSDEKNS